MSQEPTVATATNQVTIVSHVTGLGDHETDTVFTLLTLTPEQAKQILALRTVWNNIKGNLNTFSDNFYCIQIWDYSLSFYKAIHQKGYLEIEDEFNDEWRIAGRGIEGQEPDPNKHGFDAFHSEAERMHVMEDGIRFTGYIKNVDNSPEYSVPEITWAMLEQIVEGQLELEQLTADLDEEQPFPVGTECEYEQHGSDHTFEHYSGEICTIVSIDSEHDGKPMDEATMRRFQYTVKMKSTDENIPASHYELSPNEE